MNLQITKIDVPPVSRDGRIRTGTISGGGGVIVGGGGPASSYFYFDPSTNSVRTIYNFYADGEVGAWTSAPAIVDWRIGLFLESSIGTGFYWSGGLLNASTGGGTGDVTKLYVDGSLGLRDTSIAWLNSNKVSKSGDTMTGNLTINASLFVNGNVGIGTTAPSYQLHINGVTQDADLTVLKLSHRATSVKSGTVLELGANYTTAHAKLIGYSYPAATTNSQFAIQTYGSGTWNTGLYQDEGGSIGIGTTSPLALIHTEGGDVNAARFINNSVDNAALVVRNSGGAGSYGIYADVGAQHYFGGNVICSGEVTAYSDIRLKTNISNTESVLNKLNKIRVVDYNRTDINTEKRRTGVIAQELKELFPQYVLGEETLSVNYAEMVSICIKAIQEQQHQINELKQDLNYYKNSNYQS